jgi:histidine ammonia-lyase
MTVIFEHVSDIDLATLERVALGGERARLGPDVAARLEADRAAFQAWLADNPGRFVYGVTSDFGPHANRRLEGEERRRLRQLGVPFLGLSFGDGALPEAGVRAMVVALLALFLRGGPAAGPAVAEALCRALDGPLPKIPDGGLTSPGEMMPMFYLYQAIPELVADEGQASAGNSAAASVGLAGLAAIGARRRLELAVQVLALSYEAFNAPLEHLDPALGELWGDPFEAEALARLMACLEGVPTDGRRDYQAPVSYRILPRVLGQALRAGARLSDTVEVSLQAMVSNPMFLPEEGRGGARALSTGGFHNALVPQALDGMSAAWVDLASLMHRHIVKLHRGAVSGLPDRLVREGESYRQGRTTSYLEFVPGDILEEMRRWAEPSLLSPAEPGASHQDDVSAPGLIAWRNERRVAVLFDRVMAVMAAVASQALDVTGRAAPVPLTGFLEEVREHFPPVCEKRVLGEDAARLAAAFTHRAAGSERA